MTRSLAVQRSGLGGVLFLSSCGIVGGGDGPDQGACPAYIDCLTASNPGEVGTALAAYGADGSCWESEDSATACREACANGIVAEYSASSATECKPDGWLCHDSKWEGESLITADECYNHYTGRTYYSADGALSCRGSDEFAWSIELFDFELGSEVIEYTCALDGWAFSCQGTDDDNDDFELVGTFQDFHSALGVATLLRCEWTEQYTLVEVP